MAQVTNTYETYDAIGNREELADNIYQITPEKTPFVSMIGSTNVKTTHPEWQTDTLATPVTTNNQPEGDDWTYDAIDPTTRVGNYTQISNKTLIISRTQDKTDKAGRKKEIAREVGKKGMELKTDIEVSLLSNNASSAGTGNGATNRVSGGMRAWLSTNDDLGAGGSSGGFSGSTVSAATNGTQRAFDKAALDSTILNCTNAGGSPTVGMMSTYNKTVFSSFLDDANIVALRANASANSKRALIASAEVYVSDFGNISMIPNHQMTRAGADSARNVFLVDPSMVSMGVFDDIKIETPAKTGDATKKVLITEYCLWVHNEAAHGVIADTFGLTSAT